ncbi:hypothetical protein HY988_01545, partial [Candidatus Micrarchaeota archaeon]|nr:hypothetical protein [Candidatus Micrarchaeota archaeon]
AFSKTAKVVLGKELDGIRNSINLERSSRLVGLEKYGNWLKEHARELKISKSILTNQKILVPDYANCYVYPKNRLITASESILVGQSLSIDKKELQNFSLKNAPAIVNNVAFFCSDENYGVLKNNIDSEINISSQNFYRTVITVESKYGAFNFYPLQAEYVFGCNAIRKSFFCIRCYLSANLTRCFEVDSSRNCSDCYFCHNCENLRDSMFCFNVKNLTNAIGNVELPKEEYLKIKKLVLDEIVRSLEKNGRYPINIFNLSK